MKQDLKSTLLIIQKCGRLEKASSIQHNYRVSTDIITLIKNVFSSRLLDAFKNMKIVNGEKLPLNRVAD